MTSRVALSLLTATLALAVHAPAAHARKDEAPDACERIKPEQQLSTETRDKVDAMIKVGVIGLGSGQGAVATESEATYDTALLTGDDLARSWYTYQLCVLKSAGAISPQMHEELMRSAWGLDPAAPTVDADGTPNPAGTSTSQVQVAPVEVGIAGGAGLSFLPTEDRATVILAGCSEKGRLGNPKAMGTIGWRVNGNRHTASTEVGTAVDVPPGRVSLEASYRYMTVGHKDLAELVVEAGKVHYIAVDYEYRMGSVASFALRPTGAGEGEQILARCKKTRRVQ